jgi:hypothetical protein
MQLHLDSSLGGVLRAAVVLAVMLVGGWRALLTRKQTSAIPNPNIPSSPPQKELD